MGDLGSTHEKEVMESLLAVDKKQDDKERGEIDILKIGHHGSKYSSSEEFLQQVNPYVCLISAGRKNRYGHPHMETLERIDETDGMVFRTDLMGQVVVDLEKQDIVVWSVYAGR